MQAASTRDERATGSAYDAVGRAVAWKYLVAFAGLFLFFFLASNRVVSVYDDGILLTGAMRVLAGQVVHRDFYYNYGPATMYLLAGLFKVFGPSVLAARLLAMFGDCMLVITLYAITRRLCEQRVSRAVGLFAVLWLFGIGGWSLLTAVMLWATWFVSKAFREDLRPGLAFAAGALAGIAALFRYDMGIGTIGCHFLVVAIACGLRQDSLRSWVVSAARSLWAYVVGVAVVVGPAAWAYLRVAPIHDLLFDIVLYTARYYRMGRGLPWPWRHLAQLQDLVVYLVIVVLAVSLYVAGRCVTAFWRTRDRREAIPLWTGVLISFSILAAMLYVKGMVRIGATAIAPSVMACIVLVAVLYQHKESFGRGLRKTLAVTIGLSVLMAMWGSLHQLSSQHKFKTSMLLWLLVPGKVAPQPPLDGWCRDKNPLTRGECYVVDQDHIQTVEFLEAHTHRGDTLYVGLPQHDRVLINDNITYFATQRLPATKWSHFDPFLQNSVGTQEEMVADLERNRPPYVVLDSEFDAQREPNGSSVHTGVHLLDDYIKQHYRWVKTFGEMAILERIPG